MKKLLLILIVVAALIFFFMRGNKTEPTQNTNVTGSSEVNPANATFAFDDGSVTLSGGLGIKKDEANDFSETVEVLDEKAMGDLNNDGKADAVVLLARSGGGSGVFIYAAAYISGPVSYKGTNAIFLGDRVSPQDIVIANGVATVRYLDRKPEEAFSAEPTVAQSEEFVYRDGAFRER
jgi:hypothetical protein